MSALTDEQIKAIEDKGGKRWQKNDIDRLYINAKDLGLRVEYYKSGNVSGSWFNGDGISHAEAYRVMNSKVWIDVKTGELHTSFGRIDSYIKEAMTERAQAILDEATADPETVEEEFRTVYFDTPAAARLYVEGVEGLREVSRDENDAWGIAHEVGTPKSEDFAIPVHIVNANTEYGSEEE